MTKFGVDFLKLAEPDPGLGLRIPTTLRKLADPQARPEDFSRPGHIFPLAAAPWGLAERRGHTEGAVALAELAGITPVVAICELMAPDGHMASGDQVTDFAREHDIPIAHIEEIIEQT